MNVKLYRDSCESNVAIGILGSKQDIELQFNSFFNFGAVDYAELHWMNDSPKDSNKYFAYIWTNQQKLRKYFKNSSIAMLYGNKVEELKPEFKKCKGKKGSGNGAKNIINQMAEKRYNEMIVEKFLPQSKTYHIYRTAENQLEYMAA